MTIHLEPILNRASAGLALAERVRAALESGDTMTLDFSAVDRMTPSFANAFVMTVLDRFSQADLNQRLAMLHRNEQIVRAMDQSAERFSRGLRLSTQQPALV